VRVAKKYYGQNTSFSIWSFWEIPAHAVVVAYEVSGKYYDQKEMLLFPVWIRSQLKSFGSSFLHDCTVHRYRNETAAFSEAKASPPFRSGGHVFLFDG
jgi:hypothetical protein